MTAVPDTGAVDLSIVDGDPLVRVERAAHLVPARGTGVGRRLLIYAGAAWLPIVGWAILTGHAVSVSPDESLLAHFGIHVRFLIAIPLLVIGEPVMERVARELRDYLLSYQLLPEGEIAKLREFAATLNRLRRGWIPWLVILGLVVAFVVTTPPAGRVHELTWATEIDRTDLPFGAWWYYWVARTLMLLLAAASLWRIVLWASLIVRISRLELNLVPSHPDQAMGLGFIGNTPLAIAPFFLALSSLVAATWSHEILYHGAHFQDFLPPLVGLAVIAVLVGVSPLLAFAPALGKAKRAALKQYGGLVAEQGRQIRSAYVDRTTGDGELLDAPGIGPAADAATLYGLVKAAKIVPITRATFILAVLPVALPMVFVVTTEVPLKEVLTTLLKALM